MLVIAAGTQTELRAAARIVGKHGSALAAEPDGFALRLPCENSGC